MKGKQPLGAAQPADPLTHNRLERRKQFLTQDPFCVIGRATIGPGFGLAMRREMFGCRQHMVGVAAKTFPLETSHRRHAQSRR